MLYFYLFKITLTSPAALSRKQRWIALLLTSMRTLHLHTSSAGGIVRYLSLPNLYTVAKLTFRHRQTEASLSGMHRLLVLTSLLISPTPCELRRLVFKQTKSMSTKTLVNLGY